MHEISDLISMDRIRLTAEEIRAEQDLLLKYDHLVLLAPMQWIDIPALGHYWIEQVFALGFAIKFDFSPGELAGRTMMVV